MNLLEKGSLTMESSDKNIANFIECLAACKNWMQAKRFLEDGQKRFGEMPYFDDFRRYVNIFCPRHNFSKDSVQKRFVDYAACGRWLREEDRKRLFLGFRVAARECFGSYWEEAARQSQAYREMLKERQEFGLHAIDVDESLHEESLIDEMAPKLRLLKDIEDAYHPSNLHLISIQEGLLMNALKQGDARFFQAIVDRLKKIPKPEEVTKWDEMRGLTGEVQLPLAELLPEIITYWTNPDFPLWLMADEACSACIRYLTGGREITGRALHKCIERMGLRRFNRRPIKAASFVEDERGRRVIFSGYAFSGYLKGMKGAPLGKGYSETRLWRVSGEGK